MIYAVVSNKGGAGKSTVAYNVLTAVLDNFVLVEIDDNNNTSQIYTNSQTLENKVKSVKLGDGADAFDDAVFSSMSDGVDIVIDAGGGNDAKQVIKMLLDETEPDEVVFIIPLMAGRAQVQNALATYELVKDRKVMFVPNAAESKDSFVFWYGNEKYEIDGVDKKILKIPSVFLPFTPLFDLAAIEGEVVADVADFASVFGDKKEAHETFFAQANGDRNEYKRLKSRYRISVGANEFIQNGLAEFKKTLLDVAKG